MPNSNQPSRKNPDDNEPHLGAKFVQLYESAVQSLTPTIIEAIEQGVGEDPRDSRTAENFFSSLLNTKIEIVRREQVEKHFKNGTLSLLMCESNVPTTIIDMAADAYRVALSLGNPNTEKLLGIFVNQGLIIGSSENEVTANYSCEKVEYLGENSEENSYSHSFQNTDSDQLLKIFGRHIKEKLSALREITHFASVSEFIDFCETIQIPRKQLEGDFLMLDFQIVLAPVKYGDSVVGMVVTLADNQEIFSSDALEGNVRNSMIVVADAFARAMMLAHRNRN